MDKVPLLLFSGGLDSTYMLQEALMEGDVETLYVCASQGQDKVQKELTARKRIIDKLERVCAHRVRKDYVVQLGHILGGDTPDHKFLQPLLWLNGALSVSNGGERHSELRIGYVNGDSIMVNLQQVLNAWEQLQCFAKWHAIPVVFPLMYKHKDTILRRLNPHVWKDVWVCEMPKKHGNAFRACGGCLPCRTRSALLHTFGLQYKESYATYNARLLKGFRLPRRKPEPSLSVTNPIPPIVLGKEKS